MAHDLDKCSTARSLADLVAEQVKKTPDSVAVIFDGMEESSCVRITYSEMWQRANQVFGELERLGAQRKTVGVCIQPDINIPSVLLGILRASSSFFPFGEDGCGFVKQCVWKLGITYLLLDGIALQNLQSLLMDLHVKVISSERLQSLGLYLGRIHDGAREGQLRQIAGLAYCITTSGTTGTPKIVRVPHACIVPNILDFKKEFQPTVGDITFLTSPLTFDPSVVDLFMALSSGAAVLIVDTVVKMSGDSLLTMLTSRHKVTILQITPSLFRSLNPKKVKTSLLSANSPLKILAFGGERFPSDSMLDACVHPENGTSIYNVYGITEVSCWATLHKARPLRGFVKDSVPIGNALTGTRVKVVDEHGAEVENGVGQIMIGGSERVCLLNEEDEEVLRSGVVWRRTGDLGLAQNDGGIVCLGRNDRQIKRHGKRLDLVTLEKVCSQLISVEECQAVHREDRLFLFITTATQGVAEEGKVCVEVQCHLRNRLPSQYQPDQVLVVSTFPVNSHGKLDVALLLQEMENKTEKHCPIDAVCLDSWACKLWQVAIGEERETVSPADSFLSCGGDSLKAVHLVEQVEQHVGHEVPELLEVLLTKTFHDFVSMIKQQTTWNGSAEKKKSIRNHKNGLSHGMKHVLGNNLDLSEPPVKVRKQDSLVSNQDQKKWSNQEQGSNGTNCSVSSQDSRNIALEQNHHAINAVKCTTAAESPEQHPEGKRRTCHQLRNKAHTDEGEQATEERDLFVSSISRASQFWPTEGCGRTGSSMSGVRKSALNGGTKFCSAAEKERDGGAVNLELQWTCDTGKCVDASPLVGTTRSGRAVVFIGSHSHHFFAIDVCSGTVLWSVKLGDRVESSACLSPCGRRVIVGCYDHKVYVLKAETGEIEWQVTTGDVVKCSPVADLASHLVLCGSHDGFLYALNCKKQKVVWKSWMGGGGVFASPVLASDNSAVYTATLRGHVTAVSTVTGMLEWRVSLGKPVFSSPAVHGDHLYVGCVDSCFYCLSCSTGLQLWICRTEAPIFSSPVITTNDNGKPHILFGSHDSCLHCISDAGQLQWKHQTTSTVYASPFVFGLCKARRNRTDSNSSTKHHKDKSENHNLRNDLSSQHLEENLKESICINGSECRCDLQLDSNSHKEQLERKTSLLSELDTKRPTFPSRLKNSETKLCCGPARSKVEVDWHGEEQNEKFHSISSAAANILPTLCPSGDDPSACGQFVACASTDGAVGILNCATGELTGQKSLPGEVFSSPIVVGDCLVVGCRDDNVYCYRLDHCPPSTGLHG